MLFSEKYSIFRKCYFPERKMFLCVWLYFKKFSEKNFLVFGKCYKEKDKTRKTNTAPRLTLDARLGSTMRCFASSNSTTAPSIVISRRPRRFARSRSTAQSREAPRRSRSAWRRVYDLESRSTAMVLANGADWLCFSLSRSRSLSLSLSLWNSFEVKIGTEIHFRSQSLFFFLVNGNQFPENSIFRTNQTPAFPKKHFRKWFSPKTNTA